MTTIKPIGPGQAVGDTVLVYGTEGRDLYLYGLNMADGTLRWRRAASPGDVPGGIEVSPLVIDGHAVYFRPDPSADLAARMVVAAPDTGDDLLVTRPMVFTSHPEHCADGKDLCVTAVDARGTDVAQRFSVDAKGPVPDKTVIPPGARFVGPELLDLGRRQPEVLAGYVDGTVTWQSPITRYFSAGTTTDDGWHFELYRAAGLQVGTVGRPDDRSDATSAVRDLSEVQTAAIDVSSGSLAWRDDGTSLGCDDTINLYRDAGGGTYELWPVRCRYHGVATYNRASGESTYDGLDVTVEGFDVATGKTTWSVPLGAATAFLREGVPAIATGPGDVLVQSVSGPLIIDLGTGHTVRPDRHAAFWCGIRGFFTYREARMYQGQTDDQWRGGTLLHPCAADGAATDAIPKYVDPLLGATAGARTVVAEADGLVAYDRRTKN